MTGNARMPNQAKSKFICLLAVALVPLAGMECPVQLDPTLIQGTERLVTLPIINRCGLPVPVTADYTVSDQEVRKTLRFLEIDGPNSETTILPTQTTILRVVARVAPQMTNQASAQALPGNILAEEEYIWQVDFQNGDTILFIVPGPGGPPPGDIIDCNSNGIPDSIDLADQTSADCNTNGIPDECDIAAGTLLDCNTNGVPDSCDIATGESLDCNTNGIPDECDLELNEGFVSPRSMSALLFPLDETFQLALPPNDDSSSGPINLGFDFHFFGTVYNSVFINNNGNLTFLSGFGEFNPEGFPISPRKIIAPFWADVDTRDGHGNVWYKIEDNTLIVIWDQVGYFDTRGDKRNTFEVAISDGNNPVMGAGINIVFCYGDMQWTSGFATGSNTGFGGIPATVGANAGDGVRSFLVGRFDRPGEDYDGPNGANDGVDFLDWSCFAFNTAPTNSNTAPIPQNLPQNCTVRINPSIGQSLDLELEFASPEAGQTTNVIVTDLNGAEALGLQSVSTPGNVATVQLTWSPQCADAGMYGVLLLATDDHTPSATTESHIWIEVSCQSLDCNENNIPDECDPDCNGNGVPDDCDLAACESDPGCMDCNENHTLDECDILSGESMDVNTDGIPDECQEFALTAPPTWTKTKSPPDVGETDADPAETQD